jgi:hypothetical protein
MGPWTEDFSGLGLEDILRFQAANREWSKRLRDQTSKLVNQRLAKNVSQDEYLAGRKILHEDAVECRSRANILEAQVARCRS